MDKVEEVLDKPLLQVVLLLFLYGMECNFQERNSVVTVFPLFSSGSQCDCKISMYGRVFVNEGEVDSGVKVVAVFLWSLSLKDPVWSCRRCNPCVEYHSTKHFCFSWRILMMALWTCVSRLDVKSISGVAYGCTASEFCLDTLSKAS